MSTSIDQKIAQIKFGDLYPLYLNKVTRKGRTEEDLLQVISWLTGMDAPTIISLSVENITLQTFFERAEIHPNADKITGVICGIRVEEIENQLTRNIRYMDKLVDELAKGKAIEKILR